MSEITVITCDKCKRTLRSDPLEESERIQLAIVYSNGEVGPERVIDLCLECVHATTGMPRQTEDFPAEDWVLERLVARLLESADEKREPWEPA